MSIAVDFGRYFQIADNQLKAHTVASIRCDKRGCILANAVEFSNLRALVVHVHSKDRLVKHGQPQGVHATAPQAIKPRMSVDELRRLEPLEALELLQAGKITGAELETLYRRSGSNVARIAYVATADDFKGYSPNRFARCDHFSGYLPAQAYYVRRKNVMVSTLTDGDNRV